MQEMQLILGAATLFFLCVGGDGPKKALLQQMITSEGLQDRVRLAGAIPHERARDFLVSRWLAADAFAIRC